MSDGSTLEATMPDLLDAHVRDTDAFTFRMERDPLLRSTITAVAVFDRPPDWDSLVERVERATRLVPTFRATLVPGPLGVAPRWVLDPDFDLAWHLRRADAPAPHTLDTVVEMARVAGMAAFDPARPRWEFTLVGGLTDGRAALLMKAHHALTDGVGGIALAAHVVDAGRRPSDLGPMPELPSAGAAGVVPRLAGSLGADLGRSARTATALASAAPGAMTQAARHPLRAAATVAGTVSSVARFVRPVLSTRSPVMTARRLRWAFRRLDVPTADLKAAGREAGSTMNDAFLAAVTGGLRRYHELHGGPASSLRIAMPISTRVEDDPVGGNRITLVRFEVPIAEPDPVTRMRALGQQCGALRREPALRHSEAVARALNLLPPQVTGGMLKHVDLLASNVPGFPAHVYVGGARVEAFYAFGPTIGAAANVTLMSYAGTCNIGVTTDHGAVPDPDVFLRCLAEGFDEVLATRA